MPSPSRTARPRPARHVVEAVLAAIALTIVGVLALGVRLDAGFGHVDLAAVRLVQDGASTIATDLMMRVSDAAATEELMLLTIVVAVLLTVRRHWHGAAALVISVVATQAIIALLKPLVERSRPPAGDALIEAGGYSFPSAHSASSVALYGVLALIAAHELRDRGGRGPLVAVLLALCAGIGFSRIYLGAHYPTDVLAGWLVGGLIALASWRAALAVRNISRTSAPA